MTPTELHETLDRSGWLDDAHGSGTYALAVDVPTGVESIQRRYMAAKGHPLEDGMVARLAECDTCLYVGRSGDCYSRIMDHAEGKVRRASFLEAFDVIDVRGVWPEDDNDGVAERRRARELSGPATCVWTDGEVF